MGEHGDSQIVPLSRVSVGGKPFAKLQKEYPDTLGKITIEDLQDEVRQAGSGRFLSIWMGSMDRKTWQQEFRP